MHLTLLHISHGQLYFQVYIYKQIRVDIKVDAYKEGNLLAIGLKKSKLN